VRPQVKNRMTPIQAIQYNGADSPASKETR